MKSASIKRNYFYNSLAVVLNMAIPLITAPFLSRTLGREGIGIFAYCYSIAQLFVLLAKMGLTNYGTREIARSKNVEEKTKVFINLFSLQVLSTIIVSLLYFCYVILFSSDYQFEALLFLPLIIFSFLDIDWLWFGEKEFKKVTLRNIIIKTISVVSIFAFVRSGGDLYLYILITVLSCIAGYMSCWIGIGGKIKGKRNIDKRIIAKHVKPCLVMLIPVIALNIYRSLDKVMVGALSGMEETGIYENGEKLIYCLSGLISSLGAVMLPEISYLAEIKNENKIEEYILKSLKIMMISTGIMAFGLMSISKEIIVLLFGDGFARSSGVLITCAPILISMGWSNVIRMQYIIPKKLDDIYIKSILFGSILNILVNALCIPKWGAIGAVYGTLIAEFFVPIYQYIRLRKTIDYSIYIRQTIPYIAIGVIMFIIVYLADNLLAMNMFAKMIIKIAIGAAVYVMLFVPYIFAKDKSLLGVVRKRKE